MKLPGLVSRAISLREAAAVIFVLVALLPLLLFVAVISASGLISKTEAQFAAFMALGLHYIPARIVASVFAGLTVFLLNAILNFRAV